MKILIMSDIHCSWQNFRVEDMPIADLVLMAGDITNYGTRDPDQIIVARKLLKDLAFKYKTVYWIPGNHDIGVTRNTWDKAYEWGSIECILNNTRTFGKVINGKLEKVSVHGVSLSPCYDLPRLESTWVNMTANLQYELSVYSHLPPVDILVSHCPPKYYLDDIANGRNIGSEGLATYITTHRPKIVVCGHIHEHGGKEENMGRTKIYNTAERWRVIDV